MSNFHFQTTIQIALNRSINKKAAKPSQHSTDNSDNSEEIAQFVRSI